MQKKINLIKSEQQFCLKFPLNSFTDTTVISSSCTILDQILDYIFDRLTRPADVSIGICRESEEDKWKSALEKAPDILYEVYFVIDVTKTGIIT